MNNLGLLAAVVILAGVAAFGWMFTNQEREERTARIASEPQPICCSTPGAQPVYGN